MEAGAREGDLLGRFRFSADEVAEAGGGDSEEIDLELSLGGCFSSQDKGSSRLVRSSSIPALLPHEFPPAVPLARACSLPSEVEEELRRRREVQSLKRMEAMRKMEEKRCLKRAGEMLDEELEGGSAAKIRRVQLEKSDGAPSPGLSRWVAGAAGLIVSALPQASQCSIVSQGSSSSGGTELESRPWQGIEFSGFSSGSELRSPSKVLTFTEHNASSATPTAKPADGTAFRDSILPDEILLRMNGGGNGGELSRNMMDEMPSVSTKCDGPNGRKTEGFLYKYRRGEEVRIVCVCHGSFLTPAEFVKHGGGGDVAHPLRHIVVNPSPAALL